MILKWILEKWNGEHGLERSVSGQGHVTGCCECGNEPSGSIKCRKFLDQLMTCQLLRKDSAPWNQCARNQTWVSLLVLTIHHRWLCQQVSPQFIDELNVCYYNVFQGNGSLYCTLAAICNNFSPNVVLTSAILNIRGRKQLNTRKNKHTEQIYDISRFR